MKLVVASIVAVSSPVEMRVYYESSELILAFITLNSTRHVLTRFKPKHRLRREDWDFVEFKDGDRDRPLFRCRNCGTIVENPPVKA